MSAKLRVVPKTAPPATERIRQRLKADKPASMLECRCGGREMIQTKTGVLFKNGKPSGGTLQYICAACVLKGERVVVL